jgi:hypothetical protein
MIERHGRACGILEGNLGPGQVAMSLDRPLNHTPERHAVDIGQGQAPAHIADIVHRLVERTPHGADLGVAVGNGGQVDQAAETKRGEAQLLSRASNRSCSSPTATS